METEVEFKKVKDNIVKFQEDVEEKQKQAYSLFIYISDMITYLKDAQRLKRKLESEHGHVN